MSYIEKKIGKQIAGYKVEMCKNKTKIKLIKFQALEKVCLSKVILLWK